MTLSTECKIGHKDMRWGCKHCEKKLKEKIDYWKLLEGLKK